MAWEYRWSSAAAYVKRLADDLVSRAAPYMGYRGSPYKRYAVFCLKPI